MNESEGGATVVDYTRFSSALEYAVVTNLGNEISDFLARHDFLRTDLVIILLGANDYIGDDPVHNDNVQRVVRDLADNIAYMQRKGAQQVLVFNLPDLGKTPYERIEGKEDAKSQVIATHNQLLDERLSALFSPQFVQIFDLHAHVDALLQAPDKHSLSNVLSPCLSESTTWDSGVVMEPGEQELYQALIKRPDLRVMDSTTPGEDTPLCEGFFYFDDLHPATAVHKLIAEQVDLYIRKHYSPISDTSHQAAGDLKSGELTENPRHEAL